MTIMPLLELPKKYGCPACPKSYETLSAKKAHIRKNHPEGKKK